MGAFLQRTFAGWRARPVLPALSVPALLLPALLAGLGCRPRTRVEPRTGLAFAYLPPGTFLMGSPEGEPGRGKDEARHPVTLTRGVWMGRTEVTRAQWERVMGPAERHPEKPNPFRDADPGLPMVSVSHADVLAFLRRLEALAPGERFRLPTEAEWEYACRAGRATAYHGGDTLGPEDAAFSTRDAPLHQPRPAGSHPPNAWGLHDLHGNAWEWTSDGYAPYPPGPAVDPQGPPSATLKVLRGGSWAFDAASARSAARYHHDPADLGHSIGFRVVWIPARR